MDEFDSIAHFGDDDIEITKCMSPLDMLAFIASKALEKEKDYPSLALPDFKPTISMPMLEKKRLPFDINVKPRTQRRPRSSPIDFHALFPYLHRRIDSGECSSSRVPEKRQRRQTDVQLDDCESSRASKKMRIVVTPPQPDHPELPMEFRQKIEEMGGSDVRFVIQKRLYDADVLANKSRLTMPYRQCEVDFGMVGKMYVKVIHKDENNNLREIMMTFLRWDTVSSYVFNGSWNDLVKTNGLHRDDVVRVWSYKLGDAFAFALVKL